MAFTTQPLPSWMYWFTMEALTSMSVLGQYLGAPARAVWPGRLNTDTA